MRESVTLPFRILGINHLGIAPKDAGRSKSFFTEILGLTLLGEETVTTQKTHTIMLESMHDTTQANRPRLELLLPTDESSPIANFLAKKGSGIHHIALHVDNVENAVAHLLSKNVRMIDEIPRQGAHQTKIAFVHPESAGGILIELVEEASSSN